MLQWLYRYIFKGIGILFLLAMLTILYVMMNSQLHPGNGPAPSASPKGAVR